MIGVDDVHPPVGAELNEAFLVKAREALQGMREELMASIDQFEVAEPVRSSIEQTIAEVDGALARIEARTYGRCSACDGAIPPERLEVMPAAALCVGCRHTHETRTF